MTVLVTGGAGYIGSHMVLALLDAGESVVVLDNLSTGFWWAVPPEATLVVGDMGDQVLLERTIEAYGINAIVHFAAKIVVPESIADPLSYYLNNTVKSRTVLDAAVRRGVKHIIFSSTAAVYGEPVVNPVPESAPVQPMSPYGRSKLMTEWMLEDAAHAYGLRFVALRYFNVAGADPKGRSGQSTPAATHLIKVACQAALGDREALEVFGTDYPTPDGSCLRDYIHVSDLASAHMYALRYLRDGGRSETFNCGYGHGSSVLEVAALVKKVSHVDFTVHLRPRRAGDPSSIVAQADRIREVLCWVPEYDDLETIITQALAWERTLKTRRAT